VRCINGCADDPHGQKPQKPKLNDERWKHRVFVQHIARTSSLGPRDGAPDAKNSRQLGLLSQSDAGTGRRLHPWESPAPIKSKRMRKRVLMIDLGGTSIKMMCTGDPEMRKRRSGRRLTPEMFVKKVKEATADWSFEVISFGYPGEVRNGKINADPHNLGKGWKGFNFARVLGRPVRIISDAALQALATYRGADRTLFIGFGTSIGCAIVAGGVITTVSTGWIPFTKHSNFLSRLTKKARHERGQKAWQRDAQCAIALLQDVFQPSDTVIGGGNAKHVEPLPKGCRRRSNRHAFVGAERLWPGTDMMAEPQGSVWCIREQASKKPPRG
jgi:polyphosphate glucokinase